MLKQAKPKFESDLKKILTNAMYKAFVSMYSSGDDDTIDKYMKRTVEAGAKKFAETIANEAAIPLTDAIDEYIKASGLFVTVSPAGIALSGPTGPVTGTITISPQTSNINIK